MKAVESAEEFSAQDPQGRWTADRQPSRARGTKAYRDRQRALRLAPRAIAIAVMMVAATAILIIGPQPVFALATGTQPSCPAGSQGGNSNPDCGCEPCPDGESGCYPNCSQPPPPPPPTCPEGSLSVYATAEFVNATNATIEWSFNPVTAEISLTWGNSSTFGSSPFTLISGSYGVNTYRTPINYLEPSTTYDFALSASASCYNSGYTSGGFTTPADSSGAITGTVYNSNGAPAPAGVYLSGDCANTAHYGYWEGWAVTNSRGQFTFETDNSITMPNPNPCAAEGWGINISVENNHDNFYNQGDSTIWSSVWNVTMDVWASQVVNFYLPVNFLGPYTPMVLDFTNDSYVSFDYLSGLESTTTSSWQFQGQTLTTSVTTGELTELQSSAGLNLEYYAQYDETGNIVFSAIESRTAVITGWSRVGAAVSTEQSSTIVGDPLTAFYNLNDNEVCRTVDPGESATYTTTYEESVQLASSFNLQISLSLGIGNSVSVSAPVVSYSNAISSTTGTSWTLSYTISVPTGGETTYAWSYAQPGTTNQVGPVDYVWAGPACP